MVDHEQVQAALSARIDGEPAGLADDVVDAHVAACAECRAYQDKLAHFSTSLRFVEPADSGMTPPVDLADTILAGVEPEWRRLASTRQMWLAIGRVLLVVLALAHVGWAFALLGSSATVPAADQARLFVESAGLRFALAIGLLFCAWRPGLIAGFALVPGTLTAFLLGFTARDVVLGAVSAPQVGLLALLVATVAALALSFVADRGVQLRQAWRTLSADPL